jgi:phosphonate transport system permease protein
MSYLDLKKELSPFKIKNLIVSISILIIIIWCWNSTEMGFNKLIDGMNSMWIYIKGNPNIENSSFFDLNLNTHYLMLYGKAIIETIQMALLALILSIIIAFPLSFFASRNLLEVLIPGDSLINQMIRKIIYYSAFITANVFRSINELVWALLFVTAVGLGPMSGILALGIHTAGVLSKLLAEGNENIDPAPVDALMSTGAGFIKIIRFAVIPQTMPHFVSMVLYRFESDVRSAFVLGFVGAGGVGFYLFDAMRSFDNGSVSTILLMIVITVYIIDKFSAYLRGKVI